MSSWQPAPCIRCNERPKVPGRGKRWCAECEPVAKAEALDRQRKSLSAYKREQRAKAVRKPKGPRKDKGTKRGPRTTTAPPGRKQCPGCGRVLTHRQMGTRASGMPHSRCKPCRSEYSYIYNLKKVFGLEPEQYLALYEAQGQKCYICGRHPRKRRLAVDHDHKTGLIRGLLCKTCNRDILGHVGDDPAVLRRAADYLDNPPAVGVIGEVRVPE